MPDAHTYTCARSWYVFMPDYLARPYRVSLHDKLTTGGLIKFARLIPAGNSGIVDLMKDF